MNSGAARRSHLHEPWLQVGINLSTSHLEIPEYFLMSTMSTLIFFFLTPQHYFPADNKKKKLKDFESPVLYRLFPLRKSQPSGNSRVFLALCISGDQMSAVMQSSCFNPTDLCSVKVSIRVPDDHFSSLNL